jgi:membrane associated rhomboid family serine protease
MTLALVIANVLVFWYELALGRQLGPVLERWGLVPTTLATALDRDAGQIGVLITPLTSMFLHAGWLHVGRNLVYLWFLGRLLEAGLGAARFASVYFAAGGVAALAHVLAAPDSTVPAVGASGAIAGLVGGYVPLRLGRNPALIVSGGTDLLAALLLLLWLLGLLLGGVLAVAQPAQFTNSFSWWGHLGGLMAGVFLVSFYRYLR